MKSKLLIVDDSATILKIVAMAFEKENVTVQGVGNGEEALEKMPGFQPDIVVVDVDMPGMTGFQLCEKIKGSDEFKSIPVLLLTSDFEGFDEKRFKECKADDHLSKPFKSDGIVNKVKQLLEGSLDEAVKKPEVVKLSADDMVEKSDVVKLSADDAVEEVAGADMDFLEDDVVEEVADAEMDFLEDDGLRDILDDIIQDSVLPDASPDESAEPEPDAEQPAFVKSEETDKAPNNSADEISLEEMLKSTEELLSVELEEEESDQETVPPEAEDTGEDLMELSVEDNVEEAAPTEVSVPSVEETLPEEPASPEAVHVEKVEPEMTTTSPASDDFREEEKVPAAPVSAKPEDDSPTEDNLAEELSIEDLLNSAEELLKDNYLEKVQDTGAEKETASVSAPLQDVELPDDEIFLEQEIVTAEEQPVIAKVEDSSGEENLADIDSSALDLMDEGDSVFDAIQSFDGPVEFAEAVGRSHIYVEPESENLLGKIAPSAFTSGGVEGKPDLIQETLSYLSDLSPADTEEEKPRATQPQTDQRKEPSMSKATAGDMFSEVVGEHIQRILERSLQNAIAKEISGLSRTIERSVQEIVKEVTPGIARAIIQEEIEKIRKMEGV